MQTVTLGRTGLTVSRLGFGGIPIQRIDQSAVRELLGPCMRAASTLSTPPAATTVSEDWIGRSLEELGLRDAFVLATKCAP